MKKKLPFLVAIVMIFALACSQYSRDPNLKLARDFIDAYYVFADQNKTLQFVSGAAEEAVQKEIKLLKDVSNRQDSYRSRDITFELKQTLQEADAIVYLFELTIKIPQLGDKKEMVHIAVDTKMHKVKFFGTLQ